jgi:hypothetical protein
MKKFLMAVAFLAFPTAASAQQVVINFGWTAPPPLVVVRPGVQVVENSDEEVFFVDNRYWVERDGRWYWSRDHRGHWVVETRRVPVFLVNHRRGEYAHWRREEHERREERHEVRREEREMRHEERREEHREAKREHEERKHKEREHDHDHR